MSCLVISLTVICPLRLCCYSAVECVDRVVQRPRAAVVVAMFWVHVTIWSLFAVSLTQQGVEAVVKTCTEVKVSSVAGAVHGAILVRHWCGELIPVLVVAQRLLRVVTLQRYKQSCLMVVHRGTAIQTAWAAVAGHLESLDPTPKTLRVGMNYLVNCILRQPSLSYLVSIHRYSHRQTALSGVSPCLEEPLLGFDLLFLPLNTPLALLQSVQVLFVLQQLGLQLLTLTA